MRLLRHDLHSLSGAYALDALEPGAERDRFTRHLSRCQSCASEVRGFREVATAMAFAATAEPPAGLRDRVLAAAARTRQLPPEISTARPRRTRTWVPWLSGVVATASIVVAVLFGFAQAHTQDELNQVRAENQAISLLLAAPDAKLLTYPVTHGGEATVVLAADRHELAVVTTGLPALPSGQVYQLWLIGKPAITSAGLLPPAKDGRTPPVLATGVVKGDTLGLTVEPAGGSAQPTTKPILALPLPV
ncbi:MAG TPA: anti-sigma factor [Streptosporangiaceae bacterium]|nr:anti-sigma factor [Streptosporangiaceae bacterium]